MMEMMKYYKGFFKVNLFHIIISKAMCLKSFFKGWTLVEGMRWIFYVCRKFEQELCCCHEDSSFMRRWSLYYFYCSTQAYGNQANSLPTCYNFITWDLKRFYVVSSGWIHKFFKEIILLSWEYMEEENIPR